MENKEKKKFVDRVLRPETVTNNLLKTLNTHHCYYPAYLQSVNMCLALLMHACIFTHTRTNIIYLYDK